MKSLEQAQVGLGLDQPNDSHNFFELMKYAILVQRTNPESFDYGDPLLALQLATIKGAHAIHKQHMIGSLEKNKAADFIILDAQSSELHPISGLISNIVLSGNPGIINDVILSLPLGTSPISYLFVSLVAAYVRNATVRSTLFTDWFTFIVAILGGNLLTYFLIKNLRSQGQTYDEYSNDYREQMIYSIMRSEFISTKGIVISPRKIEEYYIANKNQYRQDREIRLRMIVLENTKHGGVETTRGLADEIYTKLADAESFTQMAVSYTHLTLPTKA